jgi:hypothetical protein
VRFQSRFCENSTARTIGRVVNLRMRILPESRRERTDNMMRSIVRRLTEIQWRSVDFNPNKLFFTSFPMLRNEKAVHRFVRHPLESFQSLVKLLIELRETPIILSMIFEKHDQQSASKSFILNILQQLTDSFRCS